MYEMGKICLLGRQRKEEIGNQTLDKNYDTFANGKIFLEVPLTISRICKRFGLLPENKIPIERERESGWGGGGRKV